MRVNWLACLYVLQNTHLGDTQSFNSNLRIVAACPARCKTKNDYLNAKTNKQISIHKVQDQTLFLITFS